MRGKHIGRVVKVILALLLFLCLFNMPYGYYQLVRIVALVIFSILAFESFSNEWNYSMFIYIGLAILFQPIIKIPLGREIWNIVDVVVGIGLIVSLFVNRTKMTD